MTNLNKASEDYLEAILLLEDETKKVKSIDIAHALNVSKPSVNKAMNILKINGLINKTNYSDISLTKKGRKIAASILEVHNIIKEFLISIGVNEITAEEDGCKIEHIISDETLNAMKKTLI